MSDEFEGFPSPTKNFFSLPNEMINIIAHITNMAELKVIIYIIRHTWGFHEYGVGKPISTDEFMRGRRRQDGTRMDEGTGLSNRSVIDGLRAAEKHGFLTCETDTSDKARTIKSYTLKMADVPMKHLHIQPCEASSQAPYEASSPGYEHSSHQREGSSHRSEKDTLERHLEKDTQERESVKPRARILMSPEEEKSLAETIGHDFSRNHPVTNCRDWQGAHHGTCQEYQAWIESGGRETPTEPRVEAVKIGASNDTPMASYTPGDASGGARIPDHLRPGGAVRRDGVALETPQSPALRAAGATQTVAQGATDGNTTQFDRGSAGLAEHSPGLQSHQDLSDPAQHRSEQQTPAQVTIASIPGRAASPPAAAVPHSLQGPQDGATTALESGEPRASGVTWERILADWEAVQGCPQSWTDRHYKAARQGVRASPTREELAGCRTWLPTTDNPKTLWYHSHGVELWDVIEKLNAYRSYLALSIEPAPLADMKPVKPIDIYTAAALDPERNSIEKLKERQQQARLKREAAQQQGGAL